MLYYHIKTQYACSLKISEFSKNNNQWRQYWNLTHRLKLFQFELKQWGIQVRIDDIFINHLIALKDSIEYDRSPFMQGSRKQGLGVITFYSVTLS